MQDEEPKVEKKGRFTIIDLPTSPQSSNDPNEPRDDDFLAPNEEERNLISLQNNTRVSGIPSVIIPVEKEATKKLFTRVEQKGRFTIIERSSGDSPTRGGGVGIDNVEELSRPAWVLAKDKSLRSGGSLSMVENAEKKAMRTVSQLLTQQTELQATLCETIEGLNRQTTLTKVPVSELVCRVEDLVKENKTLSLSYNRALVRIKELEDAHENDRNIVSELQLKCVRLERKLATAHDSYDNSH